MTSVYSLATRPLTVALAALLLLAGAVLAPTPASAATILSDGFGTGGTDGSFNESPAWTEGGNSGDDAEKRAAGSGNDSASPDGDRFAIMFGEDGYICIELNTNGYESLNLSYYWRGDDDAEDNSDFGRVEYRANGSCSSSGYTVLASHELDDGADGGESWSLLQSIALPEALGSDSSWFLRFRVDSSSSDEHFRIDGVSVTGDEPDETGPSVTINQAEGQDDPTGASPIEFTVVFSESVDDFATGDVTLGGTAGATTAIVTGSGTTYTVAVSGMTGEGTVTASVGAGVAHDASENANDASTSSDNEVTYVVDEEEEEEEPAACDDGIDNDDDGLIDEADPGCEGAEDDDEFDAPVVPAACADELDNDEDGLTDFPDDPGCSSSEDETEATDPVDPSCPEGYVLAEGLCVYDGDATVPASCPDGLVLEADQCVDPESLVSPIPPMVCPTDYNMVGNICVAPLPVQPTCPEGYALNEAGTSCLFVEEEESEEPEEPEAPEEEGNSGGGGGGGNHNMGQGNGGGEVLGAATDPETALWVQLLALLQQLYDLLNA